MTEYSIKYSLTHKSSCKIISESNLWGETYYQIWLEELDQILQVPASDLIDLENSRDTEQEAWFIQYLAAAARIAQLLSLYENGQGESFFLSPMDANIVPLPHQLSALKRAMSEDKIRYLLADEVGLGKTIEAGLILRELKLRGLIKRILIVAPKSLVTQWVVEMQTHFREPFQLILPEDVRSLTHFQSSLFPQDEANPFPNPWSHFEQVIVSMDSIKPMEARKGWSAQQVAEYNKSRFEDLVSAGWDLIIVDEAHRLGGSSETVARHMLGKALSSAAPYFLMLTATPHQGKTESFFRLMSLLDEHSFPNPNFISKSSVEPFLIRTEKRKALDAEGNPIFQPRSTRILPVKWKAQHFEQQTLYKLVTNYVRTGYNQSLMDKRNYIGFLMVLMQRLVVSSTAAIRESLERRLGILEEDDFAIRNTIQHSNGEFDDFYDMDGQEQLNVILQSRLELGLDEISEVELLLKQARKCEQIGPDAKAEALLEEIFKLQAEENDPELKVLIFTEFIPTQNMLADYLEKHGISVCKLNGAMSMEERSQAQEQFRSKARILLSTDAGGEGLNLQFCHVVINYDIPWNPMRLEQRIGRVDRIGQEKPVKAINLIFEDSIEFRVREVLEEKLEIIREEFGIDKTGDVLDSGQAGKMFEKAFIKTIAEPEKMEENISETLSDFEAEIRQIQENNIVKGISEEHTNEAAQSVKYHPLNHWIEKMLIAWHRSRGGKAVNLGEYWEMLDEHNQRRKLAFLKTNMLFDDLPGVEKINLQHQQVQQLLKKLPQQPREQPIPIVNLNSLPNGVKGTWALFEVSIQISSNNFEYLQIPQTRKMVQAIFINEQGRSYQTTANKLWELFITQSAEVTGYLDVADSLNTFEQIEIQIQEKGKQTYLQLLDEHKQRLEKEKQRRDIYYTAKETAIQRIGLPEVRQYRLKNLNNEINQCQAELKQAEQIIPNLKILLMLTIGETA